jgi:hypothetical protein
MRFCSSNRLKPVCVVVGSASGAPAYRRIAVLSPVSLLNVDPKMNGSALIPARDLSLPPLSLSQKSLTIVTNTLVSFNDHRDPLRCPDCNDINWLARLGLGAVRFDHSHSMTIDRKIKGCHTCYVD